MAMKTAKALLPLLIWVSAAAGATTVTLALPTATSRTIDPNFLAFGFEEASFIPFVLNNDGKKNVFSANLIEGITNRTGGQAIIRLGGTSADYGNYVASQAEPALPTATASSPDSIGNTTIGPSFWALTKQLPAAAYVVQVPLATTDTNETIKWVQSAVQDMDSKQIFAFEIGNEPDIYPNKGFVGKPGFTQTLTNATYASTYNDRVNAVVAAVPNLPEEPIFQAFDSARRMSPSGDLSGILSYDAVFSAGLEAKYIKTAGQHYYQQSPNSDGSGEDAGNLAEGLMNLTKTREQMKFMSSNIAYLEKNQPHIRFVLSEVGNSLGARPFFQTVLGSALWLVDFYLHSATLGVQRVHYQQMVSSGYLPRMWLPVSGDNQDAQVYSNYYAPMLVGDFIGTSKLAGIAAVDTTKYPDIAAYTAFEGGAAKRVAIVNMEYWNRTSSGTSRPSAPVQLTVPSGVAIVKVAHLTSPDGAGAEADTMSYGGSQWTKASNGLEAPGFRDDNENVKVVNGVASFVVNASSAVLLTFVSS